MLTPEDLEARLDQAFQCFEAGDRGGTQVLLDIFFKDAETLKRLAPSLRAKGHWLRAQLFVQAKKFSGAAQDYQESLHFQEAASGKKSVEFLSMLRELAHLHYYWTGNYLLARQYFEEGESLCQEIAKFEKLEQMLVFELFSDMACTLGDLYEDVDELERAARQFLAQVVFFKKFGNKMEAYLLRPYLRLTQMVAARGSEREVEAHLTEVFSLLDAGGATFLFFEALCVAADCYRKCGDLEEAELSMRAATKVLERDLDLAETDVYVEYLRVKAMLALSQKNGVAAERLLLVALEKVRSIMGEHSLTEAMFHFEWAECLKKSSTRFNPAVEHAYWLALDNVEQGFSSEHPKQIRFLGSYAGYLIEHGKRAQGRALWERKEGLLQLAMGRQQ